MLMAIESPIIGKNRFTDSGYLKLRVQEPKLGNMFRNKPWRFTQKEFGLPTPLVIKFPGWALWKADVSGKSFGMVYVISPGFHQDFDVIGLV